MKRAAFLVLSAAFAAAPLALADQAEILSVQGVATLRAADGSEAPAAAGDVIPDGASLQTNEDAVVDVAFDGGWQNVVRVEPQTAVTLEQGVPTRLDLEKGALYAKLQQLPTGADFEVRTPTAVASVRGTEFRTAYDGQEAVISNFSDSTVYVYTVNARGTRAASPRVVTNANKLRLSASAAPETIAPEPLDDRDVEAAREAADGIGEAVNEAVNEGREAKIATVEQLESPVPSEEMEPIEEEESDEPKEDEGGEWKNAHVGEFSADMRLSGRNGRLDYRFFAAHGKSRLEVADNVSIVRLDRGVVYVLVPSQKIMLEQPITPDLAAQAMNDEGSIVSRKEIGQERIDGKEARKYEVVLSSGEKSGGAPQTVYQWMVKGSPVPVKMEALDGSWSVEYRNIRTGKQPDALFEVPDEYQKMEMNPLPQDVSDLGKFQQEGERLLQEEGK